jgi:putative transposase
MANKAYIYRIYPDQMQEQLMQKTFGCCRFVYNSLLTLQEERYKAGEKHLSKTEANTYCNKVLKDAFPFLREVDKFALTNAILHLEEGYRRFFLRLGKHPRYKSRHKAKLSYTTNFTNHNIEIGERYIKLPKLGKVKAVIHRFPQEGWQIKAATVTRNRDDSYQVSVLFFHEEQQVSIPVSSRNSIGLDYKSDG